MFYSKSSDGIQKNNYLSLHIKCHVTTPNSREYNANHKQFQTGGQTRVISLTLSLAFQEVATPQDYL